MATADELRATMLARIATICGGLLLSLVTWLATMIYADVRALSDKIGPALHAAESVKEHGRDLVILSERVQRLEFVTGITPSPGDRGAR